MKKIILKSSVLMVVIFLSVLFTVPATLVAAQSPVNLGTTSTFAVLAGTTITNTGPTTISGSSPEGGGDVGLYPGSEFTGQTSVTMTGWTVHINDPVAIQAKADLTAAYLDAAGRTPVIRIPTELGETTLTPGVYDSESGTFQINGTLKLDAQGDPDGVFIFKTASTLITGSSSVVNLIGSARYCRVFWQVGSSATLGTNSSFVGHIFALTSITATTGATVQGQLLAQNGAVTLDTNTITNGLCITPAAPAPAAPAPAAPAAATTTTAAPTTTTAAPTETTAAPTETTAAPTETTAAPTETTAAPTETTAAPTVTTTVTGGQIPKTSTPWYNVLLIGVALTLIGAVGWIIIRKRAR